jgi:Serine aminopeptidase, S33
VDRSAASHKSTNVRTPRTMPLAARLLPPVFAGLERTAPALAGWWAERLFFTPPRPRLSPRAEAALAAGREVAVTLDGHPLPTWRWGTGPAVLLVHGWGGRAGHFSALVSALVEAGFSAVAFDAPAHGGAQGRRTNLVEIARAVEAVANMAGPLFGIVAHSAGTAAVALALDRGLAVPHAAFLAPAGNPEGFTRTFAARLGLGPSSLRAMRERAERRVGVPFERLDLRRLVAGQRGALLVVHDRDDHEIPWREGAAVADAWTGAELALTRGLGHHRLLKDDGVIARVVAFLQGGAGRTCGHHGGCKWGEPSLCPTCALDQEMFDRRERRARSGHDTYRL